MQPKTQFWLQLPVIPIFNKNVSYYVFRMPLERLICGYLFGLFMLTTLLRG